MLNIAIFFDNLIDYVPFALLRVNGKTRIVKHLEKLVLPTKVLTLGYRDCIDSLRKVGAKPIQCQQRLEVLYLLSIQYSKGDQIKKWSYKKQDVIGKYLDQSIVKNLKRYDNGEIGWAEYFHELLEVKDILIESVEKVYNELLEKYVEESPFKRSWLNIEYQVDNFFLENQFIGIAVNNRKIKDTLTSLNYDKYSSLLFLEKEHGIDISSSYISDEKINELTLNECKENERTEELADLLHVINVDDKRIDAISKIRHW